MLRRSVLGSSVLASATAALAACGALLPSSAGAVPGQIVADVVGALNQLGLVIPALTTTTPPVLTSAQEAALMRDVNLAQGLMATVGPDTPTQAAATVLGRAEGLINAILTALPVAMIPPPYNLIIIAADVIAPELEAYLNTLLTQTAPPPTPAAARAARVAQGMTLPQARAVLHIAPAR